MAEQIETGWVKPPQQITGLDHLGVQAPCIRIYSQLLPGITNVTDRARYYSLYPWLLSRYEQNGWRSEEEIMKMHRRAECLLTMISLQHERDTHDGTDDHRAAMVGVDTLTKAISRVNQGEQIEISEYSDQEAGENRYFAHAVGGLGQYYFGTLWDLGLLDGDSPKEVRLPEGAGTTIAKLVEQHVPGDRFMDVLSDNIVDADTLRELSPFCFCKLKQSIDERDALISIMLHGWEQLAPDIPIPEEIKETNKARSHTLAYLCILTDSARSQEVGFDLPTFRAMSYTLVDSQGEQLAIKESLLLISHIWKVYQRNELLSVALQGIMFSVLRAAELENKNFANTQQISEWFWVDGPGKTALHSTNNSTAISEQWMSRLSNELADFHKWTNQNHEVQCMERVNKESNKSGVKQAQILDITNDSLSILAAVLYRPENSEGYGEVHFPHNYLQQHPVNLSSVQNEWKQHLSKLTVTQALSILTKNNCLDAHLRVAMRKLSQQGKNTFRFEPTETGINIKTIPAATHTIPRFKQAIRILMDLGVLERGDHSLLSTTSLGKQFIEDAQ